MGGLRSSLDRGVWGVRAYDRIPVCGTLRGGVASADGGVGVWRLPMVVLGCGSDEVALVLGIAVGVGVMVPGLWGLGYGVWVMV